MDPDPGALAPNPSPLARPHAERRLRVWDLPTRLFHAALALAVVGSVVTAKIGGNAIEWHLRLGALVLALLAFRLLWGFVGGHWSRFGTFLYGPGALLRYLRGRPAPQDRFDIGHSPLGSLSVWALLAVLAVQVGTGLVADDEIATTGPLNRFVSGTTAAQATGWHQGAGQWLVIGLAALHVGAVLFHAFLRRRDLLPAMWHGDRRVPAGTDLPASHDRAPQRLLALGLFAVAAGLATWVLSLGGLS